MYCFQNIISGELVGAVTKEGLILTLTRTIADENLKEYTIVMGKTDSENNLTDPVTIKTGTQTIENGTLSLSYEIEKIPNMHMQIL